MRTLYNLPRGPLWGWGTVLVVIGLVLTALSEDVIPGWLSSVNDPLVLFALRVVLTIGLWGALPAGVFLWVSAGLLRYAQRWMNGPEDTATGA